MIELPDGVEPPLVKRTEHHSRNPVRVVHNSHDGETPACGNCAVPDEGWERVAPTAIPDGWRLCRNCDPTVDTGCGESLAQQIRHGHIEPDLDDWPGEGGGQA